MNLLQFLKHTDTHTHTHSFGMGISQKHVTS